MITRERLISYMNKLLNEDIGIEEYSDDAYVYRLFYEIYGQVPYVMYFFEGITDEDMEDSEEEINGEFDLEKTTNNIKENVKCLSYKWKGNNILFGEDWILFKSVIFCLNSKLPDCLSEQIVLTKQDTANLIFVSVNKNGNIIKRLLTVDESEVDIETNYNDDFPMDRIEEILTADKSALLLMYGSPGTGKTFLLRKLIKENPKLKFYWLDSSMFGMINSTEFMEFLIDCKNGVFVLEDCEVIVKDRNTNYNNLITPILNISDGMLGDSLHLKFFCTFNTDLQNVDSALLRKGRLALKYEFKPLVKDKVQKLFDKLNIDAIATKDLPLCDVYNYKVNNGQKEKKKIGF